jgi:hypothetical protein
VVPDDEADAAADAAADGAVDEGGAGEPDEPEDPNE